MPYMGGVAAIAVNTDMIQTEVTSYGRSVHRRLQDSLVVLDDYRAVIGMAARSIGLSMNETDPDNLELIREQTLKLKDNIKLYDSDSPKSALIAGTVRQVSAGALRSPWPWKRIPASKSYSRRKARISLWITGA